jgi:hypothetical protein
LTSTFEPRGVAALSRRRLFELGASSVAAAVVLAACGDDGEEPEPGRVGNAPDLTEPPDEDVNDVVYLRTLTSLEYSILAVYDELAALDGLDEEAASLLARLTEDHVATADAFATLTTDAGGEPYECANAWLMDRTLQPVVDHIVGGTVEGAGATGGTVEGTETVASTVDADVIPPSDDPTRDTLATADALETIAAATAQLYVERLSDPALRHEVIRAGTAASRRAAVTALRANPAPDGYVSPVLTTGEEAGTNEEGFAPQFAVPARFGQLTPVALQVGAADESGQRFSINIETPAENAYAYESMTCPAS